MHWVLAGVLLFAFAAPGAVVGVGFTFSRAGLLLGGACCVGVTLASCSGALLLLRLLQHFPDVKMLADIGRHTMGKAGARVGLALQMANFVLYLPVALGLVVVGYVSARVLPVSELYNHIEWPVVVLLGSMIPLGAVESVQRRAAQLRVRLGLGPHRLL